MRRRGADLIAAIAMSSCAGQVVAPVLRLQRPVAPPSLATVVPAVTPPPPAAADAARPPCELLRDLTEAARRSFPADQPAAELAPCLAGKGGAYTLSLKYWEDRSSDYGPGFAGELLLLHADAAGQVAQSLVLSSDRTGTDATVYSLEGAVDYDADGIDELLVGVQEWEFEGNGDHHAEIWHVVGDRVEPYPPAAKLAIAGFADIDADGLPDLLVPTPFQGIITGCGPDGQYLEFGPKWPMHALGAGGFAFDKMSRAEVTRACPKRSSFQVPRSATGVDNTELRARLACAVAWGVPPQVIVHALEHDCPRSSAPAAECEPIDGVLPTCVNQPQLSKWAAVKAPFTLQ